MVHYNSVLEFLDKYLVYFTERPDRYASSPEALEDLISFAERVRTVAVGGNPLDDAYTRFVANLGFGTRSICWDPEKPRDRLTPENMEAFAKVAAVLRSFLVAEGRPTSAE